jgi:Ser/Thr protein kinase RdoA (MazF antagonist)
MQAGTKSLNQSSDTALLACSRFAIDGSVSSIVPHHVGHLHETYEVIWDQNGSKFKIALQKINHSIFSNVQVLMLNIAAVINHLKSDAVFSNRYQVPAVIPAKDGALFYKDNAGNFWRAYQWITETYTVATSRSPEDAFQVGEIAGSFLASLKSLSTSSVNETIPNFQDCWRRFPLLEEAAKKDPLNRARNAKEQIDFALMHHSDADLFKALKNSAASPLRVVHNDLKITNVLFSEQNDKAVCLLDLDTCMAGTPLYDFGDLLRNTSVLAKEDEQDLSKVQVDQKLCAAVVSGFFRSAQNYFTKEELALLPRTPAVLALTLGARFLTDYLNGDKYFHAFYPDQNFVRARTQFEIAKEFKKKEQEIGRLIYSSPA